MTKEEWNKVLKMNEVPIYVWYEYYKENGGYLNSISQFQNVFDQMITSTNILNGKVTNFNTALKRLYSFYNEKFSE